MNGAIQKTVGFAARVFARLFIGLCLLGVVGVWFSASSVTDIALKGFGFVEAAVGVVDGGVGRVEDFISVSRTEVREAAETITTVGIRPDANRPVLKALSERLEMSLEPRIGRIRQALEPVRDAVATIGNAVHLLNSLPMTNDRAPRLSGLNEAISRLEELFADTIQLRRTLRALVEAQTSELSDESIVTINNLTQRIDTRLGEVQSNVKEVQADITALQGRLDARKSRALFLFNLLASLATLLLAWMIYSQVIVIRHHRMR